jgi:biopolymer transport protein ExbD
MSFWLLAFIVKFGILLFFTTTGMNESELAFSLIDIELPLAQTVDHIDNKRLCYYVSVEKNGSYRIGKYYYEPDELQKHLYSVYRILPNVIICIVADKDCKMGDINNLMIMMRKSSTLRVSFICREIRQVTTQAFY